MRRASAADYIDAALSCRLDNSGIMELLGVDERTLRRYRKDGAPLAVVLLLRVLGGDLAIISSAWDGWQLRDDKIYSPEYMGFSFWEIRAIPLRREQVGALQRRIRLMTKESGASVPSAFPVGYS